MNKEFISSTEQYKQWIKTNPIKKLSPDEIEELDEKLRQEIIEELGTTGEFDIDEYMLLHKWKEVRKFVPKQNPQEIEEVKNLIWKPQGRGDFRRIEPELVLTSDGLDIQHKDFFGNTSYKEYPRDEKLIRHWNILRVLISSSRHDGVIGRQLRYLVRDKVTKTYLGIICMGSSMMNLSERNKEVFGGDITKNKESKKHFVRALGKGGRSVNMTNGQTIMCTQPFGRSFNGGKLLSLLCLSKQIQDDWKQRYGDILVTVETTSLYGDKTITQYDGMKPYWRNLGKTSGETPIKPTDELWKSMRRWIKKRYPKVYFKHFIEKNEKGQPVIRDKKNSLINKIYGLLGIKKTVRTKSNHTRGVFLSKLYKNSDEFLQCKINEEDLIPSFDNSVEVLTEFWKFGFEGDTKDSPPHPEILKQMTNSQIRHKNKNSPAKSRLNNWVKKSLEEGKSPYIDIETDWYEPLSYLDWETTKQKYLEKVAR